MASNQVVPVVPNYLDTYPTDAQPVQKRRWEHLLAKFEELYERPAQFVSRSPGRVNLIGEHIDYMLYQVLPMAVTADLLLAVAIRYTAGAAGESTVRIANVLKDKFPPRTFIVGKDGNVIIDSSELEWSNYFKSGMKGALELLRKEGYSTGKKPVSIDILVDGTVPAGGGLSSSAAFCCASALATLYANGMTKVDKSDLTNLAIVSERFVGVNAGGMDQSASVFGEKDHALYISFKPKLHAKPVAFPAVKPAITFLIAKSFVQADKHTTAPVNYNLRVVETTLAAQILAKKYGLGELPEDAGPLGATLRGFQDLYFEKKDGKVAEADSSQFAEQLKELATLVPEAFPKEEGYTREEIAAILGVSVDHLVERYMTKFPVRAERFQLRSRTLHVFQEALRVLEFMTLLQTPNPDSSVLSSLGDLMNASQSSCRDLYACSCPELDEICAIARAAGSYGSRLTGAGWGGCTVHLVSEEKVESVKNALKSEFYARKFPELTAEQLEEAIVVSKPGSGSAVWKVNIGTW